MLGLNYDLWRWVDEGLCCGYIRHGIGTVAMSGFGCIRRSMNVAFAMIHGS